MPWILVAPLTPLALRPVVAALTELAVVIRGDVVAPLEIGRKLQAQFRLLGASGVMGMAMAGIDMAAWDALARAHELPLAKLLGGSARPTPAYNSCGLGMIGPERATDEAGRLAAAGFSAIKVRLGYRDAGADVEVVRAVRKAIGDDVQLMCDFNQALSVAEAVHRLEALSGEGLAWVDDPRRRLPRARAEKSRIPHREEPGLGTAADGRGARRDGWLPLDPPRGALPRRRARRDAVHAASLTAPPVGGPALTARRASSAPPADACGTPEGRGSRSPPPSRRPARRPGRPP